jgi:hypothetical protein
MTDSVRSRTLCGGAAIQHLLRSIFSPTDEPHRSNPIKAAQINLSKLIIRPELRISNTLTLCCWLVAR